MRTLPPRLNQLGWNRRVLTLDDFYQACERDGVFVFPVVMPWRGLFFFRRNHPVILLNENLSGADLLFTAWHEYGHFLYHTPGYRGHPGKTEREADLIATVALVPAFLLHLPDGEIQEMFSYGIGLIADRVRIFRELNI